MDKDKQVYRYSRGKSALWTVFFIGLAVVMLVFSEKLGAFACVGVAIWNAWKMVYPPVFLVISPSGIWSPGVTVNWPVIHSIKLENGQLVVRLRDTETGALLPGWDKEISLKRLGGRPKDVFADVIRSRSRHSKVS